MTREEIINLSNNLKSGEDTEKLLKYFSELNERISPQKHTIVFSFPSKTGTSQRRVEEPMYSMYRYTDEFNLIYADGNLSPTLLNIADLICMHRAGDLHDIFHNILDCYPSDKIRPYIIHNVDDLEYLLSKTHPMYDMWMSSGRDKQSLRAVRDSEAVEITTHKMKQLMSNHNNNVFITRNYFNWRLPQYNCEKKESLQKLVVTEHPEKHEFPIEWKDKCVVGWSGLTSHYEDIKKMAVILKKIHDKYPETVFIIAGMALKDSAYRIEIDPKTGKKNYIEEELAPHLSYRARIESLFKEFDQSRIKIYDALTLETYAWFNSLFDIALAFIEHNSFNSAKSEIKQIEALVYSSPCVTSDYAGYSDLFKMLRDNKNLDQNIINKMACRTEFDVNEWYSKISYFVEHYKDDNVIEAMNNIKICVKDLYDIDLHIADKIAIYKQFIEKNIEEQQLKISKIQREFEFVE
jgi:glycosyltransferase involved in cell wall biosynthesis